MVGGTGEQTISLAKHAAKSIFMDSLNTIGHIQDAIDTFETLNWWQKKGY